MTSSDVSKTDKGTRDHEALVSSVKASLGAAKNKTVRIQRTDAQLFVANVVSPAAIGGNQMFQQAAAQAEDGGWRLACILVAVFGFVATVSGMFKNNLMTDSYRGINVSDACSLDFAITTGSRDWEEAAREYGEIIKAFPEFIS